MFSEKDVVSLIKRAENGTRTQNGEEEETRTPTSQLTLPPQSSASTNSATSPTYVE